MTTWHDISDELTPEQITDIELLESRGVSPDVILREARAYAAVNLNGAVRFNHIAEPPGATRCYEWCEIDDHWSREFVGSSRLGGQAEVTINGKQSADGTVARYWVEIIHNRRDIGLESVAEARDLASALLAAADEIDFSLAEQNNPD